MGHTCTLGFVVDNNGSVLEMLEMKHGFDRICQRIQKVHGVTSIRSRANVREARLYAPGLGSCLAVLWSAQVVNC